MAITGTWVSQSSLLALINETTLAQATDDSDPYTLSGGEANINLAISYIESWFKGIVAHRYFTDATAGTASPIVSQMLSILVIERCLKRRRRMDITPEFREDLSQVTGWLQGVHDGTISIFEWSEDSQISTGKSRYPPSKDIADLPVDEGLEYEGSVGIHYYDEW